MASPIFDPTAPPYRRVQDYTPRDSSGGDSAAPPILAEEFYNPVQSQLNAFYGAALGMSASIATDEMERESQGYVTPAGQIGEQFTFASGSNVKALSLPPTAAMVAAGELEADMRLGDHGVWRLRSDAPGNWSAEMQDNPIFADVADFLWTAKVRIKSLARLSPIIDPPVAPPPASQGLIVGLGPREIPNPQLLAFVAGSGTLNWQAWDGTTLTDTGVALVDAEWYWLHISRRAGVAYWYIRRADAARDVLPTLVHQVAYAGALSDPRRYLAVDSNTGAGQLGDYVDVDMFARGCDR